MYETEKCDRFTSSVPILDVKRLPFAGRYNGSICRYQDRWFMATRDDSWPRMITMSVLDYHLDVASSWPVRIVANWCQGGTEDPRLFIHDDRLWMSFTGLYYVEGSIFGRQCLARWSEDLSEMWTDPVTYHGANPWEKNWQYFSHRGCLFNVYCPRPHKIHAVALRDDGPAITGGTLPTNYERYRLPKYARGGAPPVKVGDEWYHFFHTTDPTGDHWTYSVGLYTFADETPFNVRRVCDELLLTPKTRDVYKDVLFVTGVVFRDGVFFLSMGLDDKETIIVQIKSEEIERLLIQVPEVKTLKEWGNDGELHRLPADTPMVLIDTPAGPLSTREPELDASMANEVITRDSYRLAALAKVFTPSKVWDLGAAVGQVSIKAVGLWPSAEYLAVEADQARCECAEKNLPFASIFCDRVGEGFRAGPAFRTWGFPDLIVCDCEGGECPFFWQVEEGNLAKYLPVICGEWHMWGGRALLAKALETTHHVFFTDPAAGAGPWHYFFAVHRDLVDDSERGRALFRWAAGV